MAPQVPYPISGTIYDIDSSAFSNITVDFFNLRNGESSSVVTNFNGIYIIDLANMSGIYKNGDKILIRSYSQGNIFRLEQIIITVDTTSGSTTQNLTLRVELPKQPRDIDNKQIELRTFDPVNNAIRVMTQDFLRRYYTANDDINFGSISYYGYIDILGYWYILRTSKSGNVSSHQYTKGNKDYTTNWSGRAGLTYKNFNEVFGDRL